MIVVMREHCFLDLCLPREPELCNAVAESDQKGRDHGHDVCTERAPGATEIKFILTNTL
jgi:hypothetical protein